MTELTLEKLSNAELVEGQGGSNGYLIRVGPNDYRTVNKSSKHRLLLEEADFPLKDKINYNELTLEYDLKKENFTLDYEETTVDEPPAKHENVLWSIYENDEARLKSLHDELNVPEVREGLMDMLAPRFKADTHSHTIEKRDEGWLVDKSILVEWDGSNSPVNINDVHVVSGSQTVPADEDKEAREIEFDIPDESTVALPNGTRTSLSDVEMKFLTTVGLIQDTPQTSLYDDGLADAIRDSRIVGFTDTKSGLHHSHGVKKHLLQDLGVTDEAAQRLWYNSYDHAGVAELALRKDEFINAPIDVFENAPNHSELKWDKIESTKRVAPIPRHIRSDIESRYS